MLKVDNTNNSNIAMQVQPIFAQQKIIGIDDKAKKLMDKSSAAQQIREQYYAVQST